VNAGGIDERERYRTPFEPVKEPAAEEARYEARYWAMVTLQ